MEHTDHDDSIDAAHAANIAELVGVISQLAPSCYSGIEWTDEQRTEIKINDKHAHRRTDWVLGIAHQRVEETRGRFPSYSKTVEDLVAEASRRSFGYDVGHGKTDEQQPDIPPEIYEGIDTFGYGRTDKVQRQFQHDVERLRILAKRGCVVLHSKVHKGEERDPM